MQQVGPEQFGKWLAVMGLGLTAAGLFMLMLAKIGLFRLPGDLRFEGENWKIFFPLTSCLVISVIVTVVFWLVQYFVRK
ncbi:MAG TPA: DUF2905 domain-containing protein [Anaerohalosphaeraceae bacterium]|nr:DUF2905 domain-containing protein [Phycisphaerae bacterium]HOK96714.1 DUF2905 domain-containing protein [Anaerohalosphaeraceae bacterium]HOL32852.1 DUF2905 domain-containing protein [Anaerohalosphaeraceae bacterium]HOM75937.1 DUF2905 domain-containing protein [Anaerohalosphaeraceae bacterium]HPC65063.1 DUF2905 domain-containing protein [Anaerohalosphaeraceae bacterium]